MRSKFLFLCLFLFGMLTACKDTKWVDVPTGTPPEGSVTGKPGETEEPDDPDPTDKTFINCSYIRGDFFETNRISGASMGACNDLIYLTARPYADGDLTFDLPVNDATLTGAATYAASYNGRNGVLKLDEYRQDERRRRSVAFTGRSIQEIHIRYLYICQRVGGRSLLV
ncbi:hypothetical protein NXY15_26390 [Bacteroides thetaiotaomicron]|nr:hypothetical protein NXY15_26390 [Bacteroides thetaiotaomicron]